MARSGAELRVARTAVGLKQADVAFETGLSEPTIHRIELAPEGFPKIKPSTVEAVRTLLEQRGIQFTDDGMITREGVKLGALPADVTGAAIKGLRLRLGLSLGKAGWLARVSDETVRQLEAVQTFSVRQAAFAAVVWWVLSAVEAERVDSAGAGAHGRGS